MTENSVEVVIRGDIPSIDSERLEDELADAVEELKNFDFTGQVRSEVTGNEVSFNIEKVSDNE